MCNTKKTVISAEKCYFNLQVNSKSILVVLFFLLKMFLKPQTSTKNVVRQSTSFWFLAYKLKSCIFAFAELSDMYYFQYFLSE